MPMLFFRYFSHPRQSSGNHAPKCLKLSLFLFSILCAAKFVRTLLFIIKMRNYTT